MKTEEKQQLHLVIINRIEHPGYSVVNFHVVQHFNTEKGRCHTVCPVWFVQLMSSDQNLKAVSFINVKSEISHFSCINYDQNV